uniref:Uncharacterized protein n=1 Tax=Rhizophora mucronata TaxID=61149 RepID=A0A2P2K220_RHIMU
MALPANATCITHPIVGMVLMIPFCREVSSQFSMSFSLTEMKAMATGHDPFGNRDIFDTILVTNCKCRLPFTHFP